MKTDLLKGAAGMRLAWWCGACQTHHQVPVDGKNAWTWNGDREKPTLTPSVRVMGTVPLTDAQHADVMAGKMVTTTPLECHFWLTDGVIHYLGDCSHNLKGQKVPLEDLP